MAVPLRVSIDPYNRRTASRRRAPCSSPCGDAVNGLLRRQVASRSRPSRRSAPASVAVHPTTCLVAGVPTARAPATSATWMITSF